jgi:hypothetical protein
MVGYTQALVFVSRASTCSVHRCECDISSSTEGLVVADSPVRVQCWQ